MPIRERPLTDGERAALQPEIDEVVAALREYQRATQVLNRLLSLVEPGISEPGSRVSFDIGRAVLIYRDGDD